MGAGVGAGVGWGLLLESLLDLVPVDGLGVGRSTGDSGSNGVGVGRSEMGASVSLTGDSLGDRDELVDGLALGDTVGDVEGLAVGL